MISAYNVGRWDETGHSGVLSASSVARQVGFVVLENIQFNFNSCLIMAVYHINLHFLLID